MITKKPTIIQQALDKLNHIPGWYENDGPHWLAHHDVQEMLESLEIEQVSNSTPIWRKIQDVVYKEEILCRTVDGKFLQFYKNTNGEEIKKYDYTHYIMLNQILNLPIEE